MIVIFQGQGPRPPKPPQPELDPQIVSAIAAERLEKSKIIVREHMTHLHPEAKKIADAHGRGRPWNERNAKTAPIELRRRRRHSRSLWMAVEKRVNLAARILSSRTFRRDLVERLRDRSRPRHGLFLGAQPSSRALCGEADP
jgi:hypothetical protein